MKPFNYFWLKFVKVKVENPVALRFILQDELYLLGADKTLYEKKAIPDHVIEAPIPEVKAQVVDPIIEEPLPEVKTQAINFNYLGQNLKGFLILVHYPDLEFIDELVKQQQCEKQRRVLRRPKSVGGGQAADHIGLREVLKGVDHTDHQVE